MDNCPDKWVSLAEVVRQANLNEPEVRHIVGQFDRFLAYRQFSDTTRYSPDTAKAVVHIASLYRRGWRTEEIMEVLTSVNQEEDGPPPRSRSARDGGLNGPKGSGKLFTAAFLKIGANNDVQYHDTHDENSYGNGGNNKSAGRKPDPPDPIDPL